MSGGGAPGPPSPFDAPAVAPPDAPEPSPSAPPAPDVEAPPEQIVTVCDALGMLWSTCQLYPDPQSQPIFARAAEELRAAPLYPFLVDVGPGVLQWQGQDVPARREGAERLAKALFLHDIAALHMVGPPSNEELGICLEIVAAEVRDVRASGGPRAALASRGVQSIELITRTLLAEPDEFEDSGGVRDPEITALLDMADQPEHLAAELLAAAPEPAAVADLLMARYLAAAERIAATDYVARETIVRFFVEAVFCLPRAHQGAVLSLLLLGRDEPSLEVLLDQFAGHDLADLSFELDETDLQRLYEYARLATDSADGRPEELLALLQPAPQVDEARRAVAERVESLMTTSVEEVAAGGEAFERLRAQVPRHSGGIDIGTTLVRRMIAVEDRTVRLRRVLRIWTGRIAAAIRAGDLETARTWLQAVLEDPPYAPEQAGEVRQALVDLASPQLIDVLVSRLAEEGDAVVVERLLGAWGPAVADRLVEQLADEEQPGKRRVLMDFLATVGRIDPAPLTRHLSDPRWYVVRNLAIILGRTGRPEAAAQLRPLAGHGDHRVRVETLRALVPLLGDGATETLLAALSDPHERVRHAALTLLRTSTDPATDPGLGEVLGSGRVSQAEKERIIAVLAERGRPEGLEALEHHAARRLAVTNSQRAVRDAARRALTKAAT